MAYEWLFKDRCGIRVAIEGHMKHVRLKRHTHTHSIRQHKSAYVSMRGLHLSLPISAHTRHMRLKRHTHTHARTHTHTHIHTHTRTHAHTHTHTQVIEDGMKMLPVRPPLIEHMSAYVSIRQNTSAYASIRQHMPAYVRLRQNTSAKRHTPEREGNDNVVVNGDGGCNEHLAVDGIRIVTS